MKIINLVAHNINVLNKDGKEIIIPPSGKIVRVEFVQEEINNVDNFSIFKKSYNNVKFPIDIESDKFYIVSREVLKALQEQDYPMVNNFMSPNTTKAKKDENGVILNVRGFTV